MAQAEDQGTGQTLDNINDRTGATVPLSGDIGSMSAYSQRLNTKVVSANVLFNSRFNTADWTGVNRYMQGVESATQYGLNAVAQAPGSAAYGAYATAIDSGGLAIGYASKSQGKSSIAIGDQCLAAGYQTIVIGVRSRTASTAYRSTVIGSGGYAPGPQSIIIGWHALGHSAGGNIIIGKSAKATAANSISIGTDVTTSSLGAISMGGASRAGGSTGAAQGEIAIGYFTTVAHDGSVTLGPYSFSTQTYEFSMGSGTSPIRHVLIRNGSEGQAYSTDMKTELTTIAAAATTDTAITIPANVIVKGVSVRTVVAIPTAVTYTVTGTTTGTVFNTAAVSTAINQTDKGNAAGMYYNAAAQTIRITPNAVPANNNGRVRVTIIYDDIVPPNS